MFIQTEATPNPETLKFIPGEPVMPRGTANFTSAEEALHSPLAQALFRIPHVEGVYLGRDFISITKSAETAWSVMKPEILTSIMEHYVAGRPIILEGEANESGEQADGLSGIEKEIKELIDTRVRPAVAQDGGDIIYKGFEDGVVLLELHGACSGCPSSTITLKNGIENMLKHYIPEVERVEAVM